MMTQTMADTKVITTAVELACRAPSLHNSQPWQWVASSTSVDLFVDPHRNSHLDRPLRSRSDHQLWRRARSLSDRDGRRGLGHQRRTVSQPEQSRPPRLDRLRFRSTTSRRPGATAPTRYCVGGPADGHSVRRSTGRHSNLCCGARSTTIWSPLTYWPTMPRPRLAEASRLTEALRRYDDLYHHELMWWTAPSRESEGIPESALVSEADAARVDVNRRFPTDPDERSSAGTTTKRKSLCYPHPADTRRGCPELRPGTFGDPAGMHDGWTGNVPGNTHHRTGSQP